MKYILLIALFMLPLFSMADGNLCSETKSKGEGHNPIPESAFTEENARNALDNLSLLMDSNIIEADDFISKQNNSFIKIKGYNYLRYLREYKSLNGKHDIYVLNEFCEFMQNEAYLWH